MNEEFSLLIKTNWPHLPQPQKDLLLRYFELVTEESKVQNLTRLESATDFYWGHINDVKELVENSELTGIGLDLGSGLGVPGIPLAITKPGLKLVLAESEMRKAEFLLKAVNELDLKARVSVFHGRGEEYLRSNRVDFVTSRAVGTFSKHLSVIGGCSTWNKLIFFKGPKWEKEWEEVQSLGKWKNKFKVLSEYSYSEPHKNRNLRIVTVLRGTSK